MTQAELKRLARACLTGVPHVGLFADEAELRKAAKFGPDEVGWYGDVEASDVGHLARLLVAVLDLHGE